MPIAITPHPYTLTEHGPLELYAYRDTSAGKRDPRPAIVFFFGGGWTHGTPEHFSGQASYLAERGMVAVCVDYRVKERHGVDPDKCVEDAVAAMRWVRSHRAQLGIDPERIVAAGGSAGGHLAACTAVFGDRMVSTGAGQTSAMPNAMVLFNPVLDTTRPAHIKGHFGSDSQAEGLSPNHHLRAGLPPTLVMHGAADTTVPIWQAQAFAEKMTQAGNHVALLEAPDQSHGFFNRSPWFERTLFRADQFLASLGYLQGQPTFHPSQEEMSTW